MRTRTLFTTLALLCSLTLVAQQQRGITLPEVASGTFAARGAGNGFRSLPDGKHYTLISDDCQRVIEYEYVTGQAVNTLFDIAKARECGIKAIWDYDIAPLGHHILICTDIEPIYRRSYTLRTTRYDVRRNLCEPLTESDIVIPTFSPDGRMVVFVRDSNIFIKKFGLNSEVQVTTEGKRDEMINGTTGWVCEEEFSTTRLMEWSPQSDFLAFVHNNESQVKAYSMPIYGDDLYPTNYVYKYPRVGEQNSTVSLHLYNLDLKRTDRVDLPLDANDYIPRIIFTDWGSDLAAITINRLQNDFRVYRINPKNHTPHLTPREQDPRYINDEFIDLVRFVPDDIAILNERGGSTQLYKCGTNGALQKRLAQGSWDIISFYDCNSESSVYYQAADQTPTQRRVLEATPRGKMTVLVGEAGINRASFTQDYSYFINSYSSAKTPAVTTIRTTREGKVIRTFEDNAQLVAKLKGYNYSDKEFFTIEVAPGHTFHGWIIRPPYLGASKHYPTVIHQYSDPDSQEVLDQFYISWEYALAQAGYVVVCVNGYDTGGRDTEWRKCTYRELGLHESSGQIATAETLPKQFNYIDGSRITTFGWSFGGCNTFIPLCHGKVSRAGIAAVPVTN